MAHDPWQKTSSGARAVTPAPIRLEMARALVGDTPGIGVDDSEIRRGGPTYTVDTLVDVATREPGTDLFLIVGADTASRIDTWVRFAELTTLSTLVVVNRGPLPVSLPAGLDSSRVVTVDMDPIDVSSTSVRARVARGEDVSADTSPAVAAVIAGHHLYAGAA